MYMYYYKKNILSESTCHIVKTTPRKKEHRTKLALCRREQISLPSFKFSTNFEIQRGSLNTFCLKSKSYQDFRGRDVQLLSEVMFRMA